MYIHTSAYFTYLSVSLPGKASSNFVNSVARNSAPSLPHLFFRSNQSAQRKASPLIVISNQSTETLDPLYFFYIFGWTFFFLSLQLCCDKKLASNFSYSAPGKTAGNLQAPPPHPHHHSVTPSPDPPCHPHAC